jgi:hypothetical protein
LHGKAPSERGFHANSPGLKEVYALSMDESQIRTRVRELRVEVDAIKRDNAEFLISPRNQSAKQAHDNRRMRLEQITQELGALAHRNLQ